MDEHSTDTEQATAQMINADSAVDWRDSILSPDLLCLDEAFAHKVVVTEEEEEEEKEKEANGQAKYLLLPRAATRPIW